MFEIEITETGKTLVLPDDFEVSFELTNPFFQLDDLSGAFSFSFDFPLNADNKKALGHIHRVQSENIRDRQYDVTTRFQGVLLYTGILVIDNIKNDHQPQCEAHIEAGLTRLGEKLKGLTLKDFDWSDLFYDLFQNSNPTKVKNSPTLSGIAGLDPNLEVVTTGDLSQTMQNELQASTSIYSDWPKWVYVPIKTEFPEKYDLDKLNQTGSRTREGRWVNHYLFKSGNNLFDEPYFIDLKLEQVFHFTAFMQVRHCIETILSQVGYTIKHNLFDIGDLDRLMLYSNVHEMVITSYGHTARTQGVNFDENITENEAINLVTGIAKMFCSAIYVNEKQRTVEFVPRKEILNAAKTVDITDFSSPHYKIDQSESRITGLRLEYNFQDPKASDEIAEVPARQLGAPILGQNFPSEPKIGEIHLSTNEQRYYIFDENDQGDIEWQVLSQNFIPTSIGDPENEETIELKDVTPMLEYRGGDDYFKDDNGDYYKPDFDSHKNHFWTIPMTGVGHSNAQYNLPSQLELHGSDTREVWPDTYTKPPLMVFWYRGFAEDNKGFKYPLGNSGNRDYHNNKTGTNSMRLNTDDGLMEQWWKEYAFFRINSTILHRTLYMSIDDLANVYDLFRNKVRIENTNYIIEKLEFTLKPSGVSPVKAKMHTVK